MKCLLDYCDREGYAKTKESLCPVHQKHKREGKPLEPITPVGTSHKAKNPCAHEGCDRFCNKHKYCNTHQYQYSKHGMTWDIGTPRPGSERKKKKEGRWNGYMGAEFADHRVCVRCKEEKHWQRFCLGADHLMHVCRDCHRKELSEAALSPAEPHHSAKQKGKANMEALMEFLNRTN